jgi:autotransporter-associated beta strand protein
VASVRGFSVINAVAKRFRPAQSALVVAILTLVLAGSQRTPAMAQRVFGLDTSSAANTSAPSQAAWNNAFNDADGDGIAYKFAFLRSNHGVTNDDSQFYTNISRATTAGLLAGSYNFVEPNLNTAVVEANHYLARAGMYMKPGYLLPVFDLEAGNSQSQSALTAWSLDYMNTIFNAKGIYPIVYTNSSYNNDEVSAAVAWNNFGTTPKSDPKTFQWLARPSGSLTNGQPGAATNYPNPYGVWDPNFITRTNSRDPAINPWTFWQNGSGSPNGFLIDHDAANGNIEFVKDFLVPALWTNHSSGSWGWGDILNWNSSNTGYVAGNPSTGPAPRLPNSLDWVKLQAQGGGTVNIYSGDQTVRKFYTEQTLDIRGGSLTVGYIPGSGGKWDLPSEFNALVSLEPGAAYSAHTTQIDGNDVMFVLNGGAVTFHEVQLASHPASGAKLLINGDVSLAPSGGVGTSIIRSTGTQAQAGTVSISAGNRIVSVADGAARVDVDVRASITGQGRLVKNGAGTMQLSNNNPYVGGTTVSGGVLQIAADNRLGSTAGLNPRLTLDGGTLRTGAEINSVALTNAGAGYTSFPTVSIEGAGADAMPASANVLAGVRTIAVTAGGSGYVNQTSAPGFNTAGTFVDIVGGGGTGATAFATVSSGVVRGITITNQGTGYTSMPTIHISSTAVGGIAGSGAAANVSGITLQSLALKDGGGFDYSAPTITLSGGGGSGATASATSTPDWTLNGNRGISLTANGGTLYQTAGTTLTIDGSISSTGDGTLTKAGPGTLVLSGANTYTGNTAVAAGTLSLSNPTLSDKADMLIASGATLDLSFGGTDAINALMLNGISQPAGTWGAVGSSAQFTTPFITGSGLLQVSAFLGTPLAGDFNSDGSVTGADLVVWQSHIGLAGASRGDGDANGDGTVDGADFVVWQQQVGMLPADVAGASAVPEPSGLGMLLIAVAVARFPTHGGRRFTA